jgi:hypothetical protein
MVLGTGIREDALNYLRSIHPYRDDICHCGRPVHIYTEPGMEGFTRGMCEPCSSVRCDTVDYINVDGYGHMPACPPTTIQQ